MINSIKEADLAWLAGIIEGEGSIFLRWTGKHQTGHKNVPCVQVAMNDEDVIHRLREISGIGAICSSPNKSGTIGWHWACSKRDDVPTLLVLLRPWMGIRRRSQIDDVLEHAAPYGYDGTNRSVKGCNRKTEIVA